jgi:hypothetical protein
MLIIRSYELKVCMNIGLYFLLESVHSWKHLKEVESIGFFHKLFFWSIIMHA